MMFTAKKFNLANAQQLETARQWAEVNASQSVLDILFDESVNNFGPMQGLRVCDIYAYELLKSKNLI